MKVVQVGKLKHRNLFTNVVLKRRLNKHYNKKVQVTVYRGPYSFPILVSDFLAAVLFEISILGLELDLNLLITALVSSSIPKQDFVCKENN